MRQQRRLTVSDMTDTTPDNVSRSPRILAALRELIGALDRRTPQTERPGETRIEGDAQRLRREATAQIEELTGFGSHGSAYDLGLVEAIMSDDGGPQRERASDAQLRANVRNAPGLVRLIAKPCRRSFTASPLPARHQSRCPGFSGNLSNYQ
jgi:hypothetical protein